MRIQLVYCFDLHSLVSAVFDNAPYDSNQEMRIESLLTIILYLYTN